MARVGNGSNAELSNTSITPLQAHNGPWAIGFWFKSGSTSQSNTYLLVSTDATGTFQTAVIYEYVNDTVEIYDSNFIGTNPRTNSGLSVADTNWHHIFYKKAASGTAEYAKWIDGSKTVIDASATTTLTGLKTRFYALSAGGVGYVNASMADLAIWEGNVPSDDQITMMSKGLSAAAFDATYFWPLFGRYSAETSWVRSDSDLTVTNATAGDHPPLRFPSKIRSASLAAAGAPAASTIGFLRENAGLGAMGGGPFARANAGLGAVA